MCCAISGDPAHIFPLFPPASCGGPPLLLRLDHKDASCSSLSSVHALFSDHRRGAGTVAGEQHHCGTRAIGFVCPRSSFWVSPGQLDKLPSSSTGYILHCTYRTTVSAPQVRYPAKPHLMHRGYLVREICEVQWDPYRTGLLVQRVVPSREARLIHHT